MMKAKKRIYFFDRKPVTEDLVIARFREKGYVSKMINIGKGEKVERLVPGLHLSKLQKDNTFVISEGLDGRWKELYEEVRESEVPFILYSSDFENKKYVTMNDGEKIQVFKRKEGLDEMLKYIKRNYG